MQTGVGLNADIAVNGGITATVGKDPQILLEWSDDGGDTFPYSRLVPIGKLGERNLRAIARRLGKSRDRVFRITITDPVKRRLDRCGCENHGGVSMTAITLPSARQPVTDVDSAGRTYFTRPWFLFFQTVFNRIGGADSPSIADLTESLNPEGGAETNAALYALQNEVRSAPPRPAGIDGRSTHSRTRGPS
jgi:hypothetical protein